MNLILVNAAGAIGTLIFLLFTHSILTPKRGRVCTAVVIVLELAISVFLRNLVNIIPALKGWHTLICFAMYLAAILFLYGDRLWKRIVVWLVIFLVTIVAEILSYAALQQVTGDAYAAILEFSYGQFIGSLIAAAFEALLYALLLPVCLRMKKQEQLKMRELLPLLILPIGQILIMMSVFPLLKENTFDPLNLALTAAAQPFFFCADILWLFWIMDRSKRDETEIQLRMAETAEQIQQEYFQKLEHSNRAVAKLRHDYNNDLNAALILLHDGKTQEAEELLGQLTSYLKETATPVYTMHPVVNAILAKKHEECTEKGITPDFNLCLPEVLPVAQLVLASIFGNLLDNGIRGAAESDAEEKTLTLKCECRNGYLFIVTVNPSPTPGALREGHGLGSVILKEIAEKNNGAYVTEFEDGVFRATVTLKLKG